MHFISLPISPNEESGTVQEQPPPPHKTQPVILNKGVNPTRPEISPEELSKDYELVEEKYVAVDLRKIHSTFTAEPGSRKEEEAEHPVKTMNFLV